MHLTSEAGRKFTSLYEHLRACTYRVLQCEAEGTADGKTAKDISHKDGPCCALNTLTAETKPCCLFTGVGEMDAVTDLDAGAVSAAVKLDRCWDLEDRGGVSTLLRYFIGVSRATSCLVCSTSSRYLLNARVTERQVCLTEAADLLTGQP